jgi:hypothetical protein
MKKTEAQKSRATVPLTVDSGNTTHEMSIFRAETTLRFVFWDIKFALKFRGTNNL